MVDYGLFRCPFGWRVQFESARRSFIIHCESRLGIFVHCLLSIVDLDLGFEVCSQLDVCSL